MAPMKPSTCSALRAPTMAAVTTGRRNRPRRQPALQLLPAARDHFGRAAGSSSDSPERLREAVHEQGEELAPDDVELGFFEITRRLFLIRAAQAAAAAIGIAVVPSLVRAIPLPAGAPGTPERGSLEARLKELAEGELMRFLAQTPILPLDGASPIELTRAAFDARVAP